MKRGTYNGKRRKLVMLCSEGKQQMIYKHAISTLVPLQPVRLD